MRLWSGQRHLHRHRHRRPQLVSPTSPSTFRPTSAGSSRPIFISISSIIGGFGAEVGHSHGWLFMRNFYAHTQRRSGSSAHRPGKGMEWNGKRRFGWASWMAATSVPSPAQVVDFRFVGPPLPFVNWSFKGLVCSYRRTIINQNQKPKYF